ncbi:hypothetical protein ACI0FM_08980 [Paenochrobactrum sp. BZR 588]|uniref:hypothetical protein n=1 Tax=Paenochrobactrum TaxID=999488 RepID=UPI0035BC04A1
MSAPDKTKPAPNIWQIINPVRGNRYYAMFLSALAALATVLALIALAWEIQLLISGRTSIP